MDSIASFTRIATATGITDLAEDHDVRMTCRRKALISSSVVGLLALVLVAAWFLPMIFGPALPAGATRLSIRTEGPGITLGCHTALIAPARIATVGDALVLVNVESGAVVPVVWPAGFGAWRQDGRAVIADPSGGIIGREGDVLDQLGGGLGADGMFHICPLGLMPRSSRASGTPAGLPNAVAPPPV